MVGCWRNIRRGGQDGHLFRIENFLGGWSCFEVYQSPREWVILRDMSQRKTERSNCQFVVQQAPDGNVVVVVKLLHETIPSLRGSVVGFDLLGGTRLEQAKKVADLLNEYILDVFVTATEGNATA
jgi:hypothetical protein